MDTHLVDSVDRRIIDRLRGDGRQSFGEIARHVGIGEAAVRARYNRLRKLGIIQVVGMADTLRMGEVEAHVLVRVRGVPIGPVSRALAAIPEVTFVGEAVGTADLVLDVRCSGPTELSHLVHDTLRRIRGVARVETFTVLEIVKDTYVWAGFREVEPAHRRH